MQVLSEPLYPGRDVGNELRVTTVCMDSADPVLAAAQPKGGRFTIQIDHQPDTVTLSHDEIIGLPLILLGIGIGLFLMGFRLGKNR